MKLINREKFPIGLTSRDGMTSVMVPPKGEVILTPEKEAMIRHAYTIGELDRFGLLVVDTESPSIEVPASYPNKAGAPVSSDSPVEPVRPSLSVREIRRRIREGVYTREEVEEILKTDKRQGVIRAARNFLEGVTDADGDND